MATKPIKNEALVLDAWRRGLICEQGLIKDLTPRAAVGEVKRSHGVEVDISQISGDHVRRGLDTLMVNAAIMNARNRPENPPCKHEWAMNNSASMLILIFLSRAYSRRPSKGVAISTDGRSRQLRIASVALLDFACAVGIVLYRRLQADVYLDTV
jgi:hypothetical protein